MRDIALLPKAHLHVHLESTVRPATLRELGVHSRRPEVFTGFKEFADHNAQVRAALRTPEHFRRIAREFCADEAAQGTRYAEVTFTAAAHGERLGDLEMPLLAVLEGLAEGEAEHGIRCALILDHSRRRPADRLLRTVKLAAAHDQVIAVGLAGDESHPLAPFADVLKIARDEGLRMVHHAGESAGPASVREALDLGHAERIGHGIRVLEDPDLVAELRERRVPLEVCPFSNVLLGLVPSYAEHPLPRLREEGLLVTLNTDGETSLLSEYGQARRDDAMLAELAAASVTASFAPERLKAELLRGIDEWLAMPV
ncbi:adenosine deaminase [Nonomuraea dietziae]|uniref:adenosine deaminase n=1 Tax=Nonomuraea dietziae TaxID=65515 RepID=UPI0033C52E59